ncbi:MAG: sensor histidine kinase [Novosphingobium sp.]
MRNLTLRGGMALAVFVALVPISALSVMQASAVLDYHRQLIGNRLLIGALAMAGKERTPLIIAQRVVMTLSHDDDVRPPTPRCPEGLKAGLIDNPALVNVMRLDAQGRVLCSVLPAEPTISLGDEPWWQRGQLSRRFILSPPETSPISGERVIFGMQPLYDPAGKFDGAVIAAIRVAWLQNLLNEQKMSQHAVVAVASAQGEVLMIAGQDALPRFDVELATRNVVSAAAHDGRAWLYAAAPLYEGELYLINAEPRKELMATAIEQVRISLILPIVAILLTVAGIWLSTNRLVLRWLRRLSDLAGEFAQGQFHGEPEEFRNAPREIEQLSFDLHAMGRAVATRDRDLRTALEAKTALTSEVHHRVKNNLQIVSSLLTLQSSRVQDQIAREALDQARARIGALTQIHRLLHEDAFDSDVVDAAHLMTDICTQLRSLHSYQNHVELVCEAESCVVPVSNAVPLSLFAVEGMTNCYRHAFPSNRPGRITLRLTTRDGHGLLVIADNGLGYDGPADSNTVGTLLMTAFAQQLNGSADTTSSTGEGTRIVLRFPLAPPY